MDIKQKTSLVAILSVTVLAVSKFVVGIFSGSMAVLSSGLDNILDAVMSGMNFIALRLASRPPDMDHHYGHGKAEDLAAIGESLIIVFSGMVIIYKTVERFIRYQTIQYSSLDMGIMVLSLVFSIFITTLLERMGEKTGSNALRADALHYRSDIYTNSAVIIAIIFTYYTKQVVFDFSLAIIVGFVIIYSALKIFKDGIMGLMDTSIAKKLEHQVEEIIRKMPFPYAGYHKLRSRSSGSSKYIDFHFLICRKTSIDEAHRLANTVEENIKREVKGIETMVHIEPCEQPCELTDETCAIRKSHTPRTKKD